MELRTLENEIDDLSVVYEQLRRDTGGRINSSQQQLPALQVLTTTSTTTTADEQQKEDSNNSTSTAAAADPLAAPEAAAAATTTTSARSLLQTLQSIRGRLTVLGGGSGGDDSSNNDDNNDDNTNGSSSNKILRGIIPRIRKRTTTLDPVTEKPRYGAKTMERITLLLRRYTELCQGLDVTVDGGDGGDNHADNNNGNTTTNTTSGGGGVSLLLDQLQQDATQEHERERRQQAAVEEAARAEEERRQSERDAVEQQRQDEIETARQREEQQRQERARVVREQMEARERERAVRDRRDRDWVASIEQKGSIAGVKLQLERLLQSTAAAAAADNPASQIQTTAINALHTIFTQIVRYPEEVNYRRIRRNHPRYMEEIGQYEGGPELLIAAGFTCVEMATEGSGDASGDGSGETVPTFICVEPNLEHDMDAWSRWFDLLKATHGLLTEHKEQQQQR